MTYRSRVVLVLLLTVLAGCAKSTHPDKAVKVSKNDPDMSAAIRDARDLVAKFETALSTRKVNQSGFAVKMAFKDGDATEHIWLDEVRWDGEKFHGIVNNEPEKVSNVKLGQAASVAPSEVSDWMYIENGRLIGGYTIRALRAAMTADERSQFDKNAPFKILD